MDKNIIRGKYIRLLTNHAYTGKASPELDMFQDELEKFAGNPDYRMKQTSVTVNAIIDIQLQENLTNEEARWLRDTWLY